MQAKKSTRILSALSMAAVAALTAKSAHAAPTLSMYYGDDASYANSNNGIYVGTGYNANSPNTNALGQPSVFATAVPVATVAGSTTAVTIVVPVGDYLSLAVDAVLTGNTNPAGGIKQKTQVQPANMGLSELGLAVSSSDANATFLTPIASAGDTAGTPDTTVNGVPAYTSTAAINGSVPNNSGTGSIPNWGTAGAGNVAPNEPGFSGTQNQGGVGFFNNALVGFPAGGNTIETGNTAGSVSTVAQFGASTASYANATDFLDSMIFQALKPGTVTLNTFDVTNSTEYWSNTTANPTSTTSTPTYGATEGLGQVNGLPLLVIDIVGTPSTGPALISYAATDVAGYGSQVGTLTVTGHNGNYSTAQIKGLTESPAGAGTVAFSLFTPATDEQIFALDVVQANGAQATPSELATLVADINGLNASIAASTGVTASLTSPVPDPFGAEYNLFLDPSGLASGFLGINLGNDSSLAGLSFSEVAVVPEPMTLGLLALGGVGLMSRRHRRKV